MAGAITPDTTVLVVGAGPAGLSMAILLGRMGLDTIVVERRSGVNPHPRARSVNVRTAELMRQWGVLDEIEAASLPLPWTEQFVYCETLAGSEIGRVATSVQPVVDGVEVSPAPWLLTSQDRIEEILVRHLGNEPGVQIHWDTEVLDVTQTADHAVATVRTPSGTRHITARWLVGADGAGSAVRRSCDIEMVGRAGFGTLINCQFYADLRPWTDHRPAALYWTTHPARSVGRIRGVFESGDATAEQVREALQASARYGNWLGMDLGLHYERGCLIGDGTPSPQVNDPVSDYAPTARPGHRAPHVPIDFDGATSTLDLYDTHFVLLCGTDLDGIENCTHPMLRVPQIGVDLKDPGDRLADAHAIGQRGAVLIRPDGHVAWRSPNATAAAMAALDTLLEGGSDG